ncbi:hypothetical protein [Falsigemmobacter faecalis]|uniref:Uncharacterized protein n=1 Tax=Falsigemmobacter faecalis TaxID=2488730 RepID=A0A3P3D4I9_9RHOB|nr:hypothetical protein [Falsigemmobacter faecalis]RRH68322.1 hypothetical protein EG244_19555 [Falsigemmobacter faecalis]
MFYIRLSETFDSRDALEDIELPEVPAVGDIIDIDVDGAPDVLSYRILARRFRVNFLKGDQIGLERPLVLLHVEAVKPRKGMNWAAIG